MRFKIPAPGYNLEESLNSGQLFRFHRNLDDTYEVQSTNRYCNVFYADDNLIVDTLDCPRSDPEYWHRFFNYSDAELSLRKQCQGNTFLLEVIEHSAGLQIFRQDPFECLIWAICSQQKSIPQIKKCVEGICEELGTKLPSGRYAFPTADQFDFNCLKERSLGYRRSYVLNAAYAVRCNQIQLERLRPEHTSYHLAMNELCSLQGVGIKVANCVALFALGHTDAAPVDVHIERMLKLSEMQGFTWKQVSPYAGLMQQYMFKYALDFGI